MSLLEYVRDSRFKVHGVGIAFGDSEPRWSNDPHIPSTAWADRIVVGHNIKFDALILEQVYGIKPAVYLDTLGMARAVLGNQVQEYSLSALAQHFGLEAKGTMKTDGIRDLTQEQEKDLAEYCKHDVWLCREIFNRLKPYFPDGQEAALDQTIKMFVRPQLELDVKLLEETVVGERERKEALFKKVGLEKSVFASNVKFAELLKTRGFIVPTKLSPRTKQLIPALALGDVEFLDLQQTENKELKDLINARIAAKSNLLETRCEKLAEIGKTGKWAFDVNFSGAVQTHRYSGGSGAGGNPQNFTRNSSLRKAVKAPAGHKLIVGDFANIEMRLVAYLAKDPGLIQALERKEDVYCKFATAFFGREITKENEEERRFGKTAILGLGYGMGPTKFQKTVRLQTGKAITDEDARKAVKLYRSLYNRVPALWTTLDRDIKSIAEKGFYVLPSGLMLQYSNLRIEENEWVYDVWGNKGIKDAAKLYGGKLLENICQALAGELCKEAMLEFGDKVVGQIHDEIILLEAEDRADLTAKALYQVMITPPTWLPQICLGASVGIGNNWMEAK